MCTGLSTGAFQCRFLFRIRLVPAVILQVAHVNARLSLMDGKPRPMSCVRLSGVHAFGLSRAETRTGGYHHQTIK